jgi:hypothetical protein
MQGSLPVLGRRITCRRPYRTRAMQDPGYELRRIHLPRTWVNKGKKQGRSVVPRPRSLESILAVLLCRLLDCWGCLLEVLGGHQELYFIYRRA